MKIKPGPNQPMQSIAPTFRGRVQFLIRKNGIVATKWPKKRPGKPTPAQQDARDQFLHMVKTVQAMMPEDHEGAMRIAEGSVWTWRDVLSTALQGKLVVLENWDQYVAQNALDTISTTLGALVIRGLAEWVGLNPSGDGKVLTLVDGAPAWADIVFPPSGIDELTGEVIAGPGSGAQAAELSETGVTPGSYTTADLTIDAKGRITAASNGAGGGGGVGGLYSSIMSVRPTSLNTGLTTWLNQGAATVTDGLNGVTVYAPTSGGDNIRGRTKPVPAGDFVRTVLLAMTADRGNFQQVGFGFYDGTNKVHAMSYDNSGGIALARWNSPTSFNGADAGQTAWQGGTIWVQIERVGTQLYFRWSQTGDVWLEIFNVSQASGFLGSTGYSNFIFYSNVNNTFKPVFGHLLSYT